MLAGLAGRHDNQSSQVWLTAIPGSQVAASIATTGGQEKAIWAAGPMRSGAFPGIKFLVNSPYCKRHLGHILFFSDSLG